MVGKVFSGEIDLAGGSFVPAVDWYVGETRQGWTGFAAVNPGPGENLDPEVAFARAVNYGLYPGTPIRMALWGRPPSTYSHPPRTRGADVEFVRSWPSVVTAIHTPASLEARHGDRGAMIVFADPITFLLRKPIWGVFGNRSPGELLAGGLFLARGIHANPSLKPHIPGLPGITITESLPEGLEEIPYAIAAGETLGAWLGAIFGRLGIRMELLGDRSGMLHVALRAGEPTGTPVELTLATAEPTAGSAVISSCIVGSGAPDRSVLLDNPSIGQPQRIGSGTSVGRLQTYTTEEVTLDEAVERVTRAGQRTHMNRNLLRVVTRQPGLHSGRIVEFDQPVTGADRWQVNRVAHGADDGRYRNEAQLTKLGIWTPETPPSRGTVVLTGVVHAPDAEEAEVGDPVPRDVLSRVPVRLGCSQGDPVAEAPEEAKAGGDDPGEDGDDLAPPELMLSVVGPMAGGVHGFVPAHRHGDVCEVAVHHPLAAEVVGFSYSDHRRMNEGLVDLSMGIVASHDEDAWSGMVFRPGEVVEKEEEEEEKSWRAEG